MRLGAPVCASPTARRATRPGVAPLLLSSPVDGRGNALEEESRRREVEDEEIVRRNLGIFFFFFVFPIGWKWIVVEEYYVVKRNDERKRKRSLSIGIFESICNVSIKEKLK